MRALRSPLFRFSAEHITAHPKDLAALMNVRPAEDVPAALSKIMGVITLNFFEACKVRHPLALWMLNDDERFLARERPTLTEDEIRQRMQSLYCLAYREFGNEQARQAVAARIALLRGDPATEAQALPLDNGMTIGRPMDTVPFSRSSLDRFRHGVRYHIIKDRAATPPPIDLSLFFAAPRRRVVKTTADHPGAHATGSGKKLITSTP